MSRKYAILGETLKHTMSPPIHARLFELKGREFEYEILEVKPEELKDKAEYLNSLNGYNITIPHKIGIIDYTDELDQSAKRYHSVNCVDNKNGRHVGYNTDCDGFLRTVRAMNIDFTGKILLIGCGGVGRMMAIEAALAGADLYIAVLESDMPLAKQVEKEIKAMKSDARITIVLNTEIPTAFLPIALAFCMSKVSRGLYITSNTAPLAFITSSGTGQAFVLGYIPTGQAFISSS